MRRVIAILSVFFMAAWPIAVQAQALDCNPVDFLKLRLEKLTPDPAINSVLLAYPGIQTNAAETQLISADGRSVAISGKSQSSERAALETPTFGDQFRYVYPLDPSLEERKVAWVDPGRLRNTDFMTFLYFNTEAAARETLVKVTHKPSGTAFRVTDRHGIPCQLSAVFAAIGSDHPRAFQDVGGSFNWRRISGTDRLSVHSYGAAIDLNAKLGGYWQWAGSKAGAVGDFENRIPLEVVQSFERYGFIWGGKWHHYDGMHFEYRPELILFARLVADPSQ